MSSGMGLPYMKSTAQVKTSGEQSFTSISDLDLTLPTPVVRAVAKYFDLKLRTKECALTSTPSHFSLMSPSFLSKVESWDRSSVGSNFIVQRVVSQEVLSSLKA